MLLADADWCTVRLIHTGRHYDANISDSFFRDFGLARPDIHLDGGGGSHAEQIGRVMIACDRDRRVWFGGFAQRTRTVAPATGPKGDGAAANNPVKRNT